MQAHWLFDNQLYMSVLNCFIFLTEAKLQENFSSSLFNNGSYDLQVEQSPWINMTILRLVNTWFPKLIMH